MYKNLAIKVCVQIAAFALLLVGGTSVGPTDCFPQNAHRFGKDSQTPCDASSYVQASEWLSPSLDIQEILQYAERAELRRWGISNHEFLFEEFAVYARDVARIMGEEVKTLSGLRNTGWLPFEPLGVIKDFSTRECAMKPMRFTGLEPEWEVALQKKLIVELYSSLIPLSTRFSSREEIEMVYGSIVPQFFINPLNGEPIEFVFGEMNSPVKPPYVEAGSPITGVGPISIAVKCFQEPLVDNS
jgi:hypothetical protein